MTKEGFITIGTLNLTGIPNIHEIVEDINRSIGRMQAAGNEQTAEILRILGQVAFTDPRLEKRERKGTIESVQWLAREATLPPEERHISAVKGTLRYFPMLLRENLSLLNYFEAHLDDLKKFFDID